MKTDFHDKKIPETFHYICLMVILMDSVLKNDDKYYPQVLLEKCKYIIKEKKKHSYIEEELENSSDESDEESDKESDKE